MFSKIIRKPHSIIISSLAVSLLAFIILIMPASAAAFNQNDLIDDPIFNDNSSMSASQIDTFLNSFPDSCISTNNEFWTPDPTGWSSSVTTNNGYTFGGRVSAGQAIYDASQFYDINPQVLLATMQKEQSIVTGTGGCHYYNSNPGEACVYSGGGCVYIGMSYACPSGCSTAYSTTDGTGSYGIGDAFSLQLIAGSWLLRWSQERSYGILTGYAGFDPGDNNIWYSGPMTAGYRQRDSSDTSNYYDGTDTLSDGTSVNISNGATAALYFYTPYISGNEKFDSIYQSWFGPTSIASDITMTNITQPDTTPALGQTVSYSYSLTNNLPDSITLSAVGVVGRLGSINNGANRDLGWQGPITILAGATQTFTFTSVIRDLGAIYVWPAINNLGIYTQYNSWGTELNTHVPNLSLVSPLTSTIANPIAGQTATLSATVKNNESQPIQMDAIGIPIRFFGKYNYDTGWTLAATIQPGATQVISGNVTFDKPGPYTAWLSVQFGTQYVTLSPTINLNASVPVPNFQLTYTETPDLTPALGENVSVQFNLTNNSGVAMTLDNVGVVGRYGSPYANTNNDFGWVGPETFSAGEEKSYTTFVSNISELSNFYAWVAIQYQGAYIQYNNWGFIMTPHLPDPTISTPISIDSNTQPTLNQPSTVTVTITNNEPNPIYYSAIGIPIRYYGTYNYDAVGKGQVCLPPQAKAVIRLVSVVQ